MNRLKKFLAIVLIILSLFIILSCAYFVYKDTNDSNIENKDTSEKDDKKNINDSDLDKIDVNSLIERFNYLSNSSTTDSVKLYTDEFNNYDNLSDEYKYGLTMNKVNYKNSESSIYNAIIYDKFQFNKVYHELFGYDKDIALEHFSIVNSLDHSIDSQIDFIHTCPMLYNGDDVYYAIYECGGISNIYGFLYKVENTNLNENTLQIVFKSLIVSSDALLKDGDTKNGIINPNSVIENLDKDCDYNLCKTNFNSDYTKEMKQEDTDIIMSKYFDKINTYKLTLQYDEEHNNYYFYTLEKLN